MSDNNSVSNLEIIHDSKAHAKYSWQPSPFLKIVRKHGH